MLYKVGQYNYPHLTDGETERWTHLSQVTQQASSRARKRIQASSPVFYTLDHAVFKLVSVLSLKLTELYIRKIQFIHSILFLPTFVWISFYFLDQFFKNCLYRSPFWDIIMVSRKINESNCINQKSMSLIKTYLNELCFLLKQFS